MPQQRLCSQCAFLVLLLLSSGLARMGHGDTADTASSDYIQAIHSFADTVLEHGRDHFGKAETPLFVDGLHVESLEPVRWKCRGETWVLCNIASQQPLFRLLDGLTALTGEKRYSRAAVDAARYALENVVSPSGLLYWGGHVAWDLETERPVGQYEGVHELKGHQPYYSLMWGVNAPATRKLLEGIWATHILDWSTLDYNRHSSMGKYRAPRWDAEFDEDLEIPFPTDGSNLSFVNVTPPLLYAGAELAVLGRDNNALLWSRRLAHRWQEARHPETGLSGGQLSYRKHDRAQDALGHVHPAINEAMVVASYHQTCRYHHLPLAQMQAGLALRTAGGRYAEVGDELIRWAVDDLEVYARRCWDPETGRFVARMTDGTEIRWQESKTGYYVPGSFRPRAPDGFALWGYALAYRLTRRPPLWNLLRQAARIRDLGDPGKPDGSGRSLRPGTEHADWRTIYALLELHDATGDADFVSLARRVADNILKAQTKTGLFPRAGRLWARTGDEAPLAILHLAAALEGKRDAMPPAVFDSRFFHCEYHGELEARQKKRADKRTYDHLVFYGE